MTWEEYGTQEVAADRKTWCKLVKTLCPMVDEMTDEDMWIGDLQIIVLSFETKASQISSQVLKGYLYVGK